MPVGGCRWQRFSAEDVERRVADLACVQRGQQGEFECLSAGIDPAGLGMRRLPERFHDGIVASGEHESVHAAKDRRNVRGIARKHHGQPARVPDRLEIRGADLDPVFETIGRHSDQRGHGLVVHVPDSSARNGQKPAEKPDPCSRGGIRYTIPFVAPFPSDRGCRFPVSTTRGEAQ